MIEHYLYSDGDKTIDIQFSENEFKKLKTPKIEELPERDKFNYPRLVVKYSTITDKQIPLIEDYSLVYDSDAADYDVIMIAIDGNNTYHIFYGNMDTVIYHCLNFNFKELTYIVGSNITIYYYGKYFAGDRDDSQADTCFTIRGTDPNYGTKYIVMGNYNSLEDAAIAYQDVKDEFEYSFIKETGYGNNRKVYNIVLEFADTLTAAQDKVNNLINRGYNEVRISYV